MMNALERLFKLRENRTSLRTELIAGFTTFMTMAYIIAVNPFILAGTSAQPGPLGPQNFAPTVAATCLGAAVVTLLMGFWANYPFALASGMGLNAALVAAVGSEPGITWRVMMGVVFMEGLFITLLVLTRMREWVMNAIPLDLKRAIGVGIGLFIALLGLHQAHWMNTTRPLPGNPMTLPPVGFFHMPTTLLASFGILISAWLVSRRTKGALLMGIVATTVVALLFHLTPLPSHVVEMPHFTTFGQLSLEGIFRPGLIALVFAFMISDFFDTMGTVIAVGEQAGYLDKEGRLPRLNRVLLVDSIAAMWGGICSCSSVTTYVESASGVGEGGRTGLTSVVVGVLFLIAMFFAPLVGIIPSEATAAALVIVGFLMLSVVKDIDFNDYSSAIPAFLILILIPLTMSIARGIGIGFIAYVVLKALSGKAKEVPIALWILAALFALSFYLEKMPG
jgi:AGZA family xanthine/uracil permease-like MFS transporter